MSRIHVRIPRPRPMVVGGTVAVLAAAAFPFVAPADSEFRERSGLRQHLAHLLAAVPAAGAAPAALPRTGWTVTADSQESYGNGLAANAIDGSATTLWHTRWKTVTDPLPHTLTIDTKKSNAFGGLVYQPRPVQNRNGNIGRYEVRVSANGTTWGAPVATGTFADDANIKTVTFPSTTGRYVRLTALTEAGGRGPWSNAAEVNLLGAPPPVDASRGAWSQAINFPLVPGGAAQLPNGKILTWSAYLPYDWSGNWYGIGRTQTATYDPATGTVSARTVTETGHDMFCPGTATLPDGRIVVTGGTTAAKTSVYNPSTSTWTSGPNMKVTRGYQASTTLADGRVFVLGGSWSGGVGGKDGEVWSQAGGWQRLSGVPVAPILTADPKGQYRSDNHGWFFTWTGNRVFHAGPSKQMNWFSTAGNGSWASAGNRGDDGHAMNGNAVMYDAGKILTVGGAPAYDDNSVATNRAYVIDITNGTSVRKVAPMAHTRTFHNSVVLPDGKVVVVGGQNYAAGFSDRASVYDAEIWDPATERFTTLAPAAIPRNYHSVASLLPDGRVLSAGGGMCGNCATNHADAQIFTPPYLLNADGSPKSRPVITAAPTTATAGGSVQLTTNRAASTFSIVRIGAVTHTVNNDQRRISLKPSSTTGTTYTLPLPADRGIVLPGYYLLFAMDANGVPSVAKSIRIS